jgi:citrate synthase
LNPLRRTGKDELLETAMALHDAAIKDEYFVKRKLAPNVDFWYVLLPTFLFQGHSYPILGGKLFVALRMEE